MPHPLEPPGPDVDTPIAIIGAGFAGIGMGIALTRAGYRDFTIYEKDDDVGGTWKVNTYPGCACDVPSHLYSFSFAPNPEWSRAFSPQQEIWAYQKRLVDEYDLLPKVRRNTQITGARFDDEAGIWRLTTDDGQAFTARVLISGMGGLSRPAFPNIPGREDFAGTTFHSQQWRHDYDLEGKTVAVIGTGASAIQFVPQIATKVRTLHLFQRTPPWILPKADRALSGGEHALFRKLPFTQRVARRWTYLTLEWRAGALVFFPTITRLAQFEAERHIARHIDDPAMRAALTPSYRMGCKRVLLSNDYLPALNRENVELVTTAIDHVSDSGVCTVDGATREVDAIIYGTGFQAADPVPPGVVFGREGRDLMETWAEGPEAYKGTTVAGYPNLFFLVGPNTGIGHTSVLFMLEAQMRYVLDALATMAKGNTQWVDVKPDVMAEHNRWLQKRMAKTVWSTGGCNSWYMNEHGKNVTLWPGFTTGFWKQLRRFDHGAYEHHPA